VINDVFFICSATSERQVNAISGNIRIALKNEDILPGHTEGEVSSQWVLMDYGDIIVHIFLDKVRKFYRLEDLWHNAEILYHDNKE